MTLKEILAELESQANPKAVEGMRKYGITPEKAYGVSIPNLRKLAKKIGTNHKLALELWEINTRETRILASMIDDPNAVLEEQMDKWANDFDYWEICDQVCLNLFVYTPYAKKKALEWIESNQEYVKRAGFALIAIMAWKLKKLPDEELISFIDPILMNADDERNTVKKAVSWVLRQIGKRSPQLHQLALEAANTLLAKDSKPAKWIAKDVIKELTSTKVIEKMKKKGGKPPTA